MESILRFYSLVIRIAIALAMLGLLKSCTIELMGLAARSGERGMISYSRYTHLLTDK